MVSRFLRVSGSSKHSSTIRNPTKQKNKAAVVIRRPSDGKVSLQDSELGEILSGFGISYLSLCNFLFFYGGRKEDPSFPDSGQFLPIMLGKDASYFGKDDSFFSLRNHLPVITFIEGTSLFCRRRRSQFMSELMLVKWKSSWHLHLG